MPAPKNRSSRNPTTKESSRPDREEWTTHETSPFDGGLDRVRDILFGDQVREIRDVLTRVEREVSERLGAIETRIEQTREQLEARIDAANLELRERSDESTSTLRTEVDERIEELTTTTRDALSRLESPEIIRAHLSELLGEMAARLADGRTHGERDAGG